MLVLEQGILNATFAALRGCGGGVRECVAYWLGPQMDLAAVTEVIQPAHVATAHHYEIDDTSLTEMLLELRTTKRAVRAQVHTHPGPFVRHSPTDETFALAPSRGFVSLVLPHFAMGPVSLDGSYAAVIGDDGWTDVEPQELIQCR